MNFDLKQLEVEESSKRITMENSELIAKFHYLKTERDHLEIENIELRDRLKSMLKEKEAKPELHPSKTILAKIKKKKKAEIIQSMPLPTVERIISQFMDSLKHRPDFQNMTPPEAIYD